MAKIVVVVEIKDRTAAEVIRDAQSVEDVGQMPMPDAWDVLGLLWGGDLEHLEHTVIVDAITD